VNSVLGPEVADAVNRGLPFIAGVAAIGSWLNMTRDSWAVTSADMAAEARWEAATYGASDGAGGSSYIGPWSGKGVSNIVDGGTFTQCGSGSCVSATAQILSNGAVTEAQALSILGEWADPLRLPDVLNKLNPGLTPWQGKYFWTPEEALSAANRGTMGAVLQAPTEPAHMVTISPIQGTGKFLVQDTGLGKTYDVTADWIKQYVSAGVWK